MSAPPARAQREFAREELEKELLHDYSTSGTGVVPAGERRSRWHFKGFARIDELGGNPPVGEGTFPLPFLSGVALAGAKALLGFARPLRREAGP